jgi:hypothetical protein
MTARISNIAREANRTYRVTLESETGGVIGSYVFTVGGQDLEFISWSDDFAEYTKQPLRKLFEAISAFHEAQSLDLPAKEPKKSDT